jgi:hypothetical protein
LSVNWVCATPSETFLLKWEHVHTLKTPSLKWQDYSVGY